jgi:hypothetical protein
MASADSESPDDSFFNDLAQQPDANDNGQEAQNDGTAKQKRIACVLCRKRKLKCDGTRPTCGTCKRLSHDCAYDEVRKKSGPKRGYVKLLEQRLRTLAHSSSTTHANDTTIEQVEHLLKTQDTPDTSKDPSRQDSTSAYVANTLSQTLPNAGDYLNTQDRIQDSRPPAAEPVHNGGSTAKNGNADFSWEMIGLGLEEPLPPQDVMDELWVARYARKSEHANTWDQISNLLYQGTSLVASHPQTTFSCCFEPCTTHATSSMSTLHHVDAGSFGDRQIRGSPGALLPASEKVRPDGRDERPWGVHNHPCALSSMDPFMHVRIQANVLPKSMAVSRKIGATCADDAVAPIGWSGIGCQTVPSSTERLD